MIPILYEGSGSWTGLGGVHLSESGSWSRSRHISELKSRLMYLVSRSGCESKSGPWSYSRSKSIVGARYGSWSRSRSALPQSKKED